MLALGVALIAPAHLVRAQDETPVTPDATGAAVQQAADAVARATAQAMIEQTPQAAATAATAAIAQATANAIARTTPRKPTGLAELIRAKFPLALQISDLGQGWREFDWNRNVYFTKGETWFLSNEEYLIVYKSVDEEAVRQSPEEFRANQSPLYRETLHPTSRLQLDALPMSSILPYFVGGNSTLRSFTLKDYRDGVKDKARVVPDAYYQNLSVIYLRKIGEAIKNYNRDYLDVMPPMPTAFIARDALEPYAQNTAIFTQPGSAQPFRFNALFSGRKRAHLKGKGSWIVAYEGEAALDGSRAVLLLSGRVYRAGAKHWERLREVSKQ